MSKTVIGTFDSRDGAERAIKALKSKGFEKDISVLAKHDKAGGDTDKYNARFTGGDSVTDGAGTGGVIGGLAGLAAGMGALAIPGLGPLLAAGPIAGLLSGAATGGIAGGLADYGIPSERGRFFEDRVKQGRVLVSLRCDDTRAGEASGIMNANGGQDVGIH